MRLSSPPYCRAFTENASHLLAGCFAPTCHAQHTSKEMSTWNARAAKPQQSRRRRVSVSMRACVVRKLGKPTAFRDRETCAVHVVALSGNGEAVGFPATARRCAGACRRVHADSKCAVTCLLSPSTTPCGPSTQTEAERTCAQSKPGRQLLRPGARKTSDSGAHTCPRCRGALRRRARGGSRRLRGPNYQMLTVSIGPRALYVRTRYEAVPH